MNKLLIGRIVNSIQDDRRLKNIPVPIIEEVISQTLNHLVYRMEMPDDLKVSELDDDLESCQGCTVFLRNDEVNRDSQGVALCFSCFALEAPTKNP